MPIPDDYREIITMLSEATVAGRVNWFEKGGTIVVRLPQYTFEIWSGTDAGSEKQFVAVGLKEPSGEGLIDNWYVEEDDVDFADAKKLYDCAKRQLRRVPEKLDELRKLLLRKEKLGLDDKEKPQ